MDTLYTTPGGFRRLIQRLEQAKADYYKVCASNEEAAGAGDSSVWHDNFAYEENQRQMHQLSHRVREFESLVQRIQQITLSSRPLEVVSVGACLRVRYEEEEREQVLFIGGYEDGDPASDRISYNCPLARALIGHRPGDVVEVRLGNRIRSIEILGMIPPPREEVG